MKLRYVIHVLQRESLSEDEMERIASKNLCVSDWNRVQNFKLWDVVGPIQVDGCEIKRAKTAEVNRHLRLSWPTPARVCSLVIGFLSIRASEREREREREPGIGCKASTHSPILSAKALVLRRLLADRSYVRVSFPGDGLRQLRYPPVQASASQRP